MSKVLLLQSGHMDNDDQSSILWSGQPAHTNQVQLASQDQINTPGKLKASGHPADLGRPKGQAALRIRCGSRCGTVLADAGGLLGTLMVALPAGQPRLK